MPDRQEVPAGARPHHYLFSHRWLPGTFARIPEKIMLALARARSPEPLRDSWARLAKNLPEEERLQAEAMAVETYRLSDAQPPTYMAVVSMPEPIDRVEAHFIGLTVQPSDGELNPESEEEGGRPDTNRAYYILERGEEGGAESGTRLRRWNGEEFVDLQDALEATEEAFIRAVRAELQDR